MKKKLLVLLGASVLMLSSCSGSTKLDDVKKLYEGETYSEWHKGEMSNPEETITWVGDDNERVALENNYVNPCKADVIDEFAFAGYTSDKLNSDVYNFNAVCDLEAAAAATYGEEFTYEIKGSEVTATLTASKTVTNADDEAQKFSVGLAFSYIVKYGDHDKYKGLPMEISFVFALVRENAKEAVVASYLSTVTRTIEWAEYR